MLLQQIFDGEISSPSFKHTLQAISAFQPYLLEAQGAEDALEEIRALHERLESDPGALLRVWEQANDDLQRVQSEYMADRTTRSHVEKAWTRYRLVRAFARANIGIGLR